MNALPCKNLEFHALLHKNQSLTFITDHITLRLRPDTLLFDMMFKIYI
jgi:hypothetical protein